MRENVAFARATAVKGSVQKLNLICKMITGRSVDDAALQLKFSRKKLAVDVAGVLSSAIANAENNHGMDIANLYVKEVVVGKSFTLKDFMRELEAEVQKYSSRLVG